MISYLTCPGFLLGTALLGGGSVPVVILRSSGGGRSGSNDIPLPPAVANAGRWTEFGIEIESLSVEDLPPVHSGCNGCIFPPVLSGCSGCIGVFPPVLSGWRGCIDGVFPPVLSGCNG